MNRKVKFLIVLVAVFFLRVMNAGGQTAYITNAGSNTVSVIDMQPIPKEKKPKEGLNLIFIDTSGTNISVKIKDNTKWVVKDKDGKDVPTSQFMKKTICMRCYNDGIGDQNCKLEKAQDYIWNCYNDGNGDQHCIILPSQEGPLTDNSPPQN
jgi:DNA-binding beta-propeller fold protein YncE